MFHQQYWVHDVAKKLYQKAADLGHQEAKEELSKWINAISLLTFLRIMLKYN